MTFSSAVSELGSLLEQSEAPLEVRASAARFVCRLDRCLVIVPEMPGSIPEQDYSVRLEPSVLFSRYLDAARSGEWQLLLALEAAETVGAECDRQAS